MADADTLEMTPIEEDKALKRKRASRETSARWRKNKIAKLEMDENIVQIYKDTTWKNIDKLETSVFNFETTMDMFEKDRFSHLAVHNSSLAIYILCEFTEQIIGWCLCHSDRNQHHHAHILIKDYDYQKIRDVAAVMRSQTDRKKELSSRPIGCKLHWVATLHYICCPRTSQGGFTPHGKSPVSHFHYHLCSGFPAHASRCSEIIRDMKEKYQSDEHYNECKCHDTKPFVEGTKNLTQFYGVSKASAVEILKLLDMNEEEVAERLNDLRKIAGRDLEKIQQDTSTTLEHEQEIDEVLAIQSETYEFDPESYEPVDSVDLK